MPWLHPDLERREWWPELHGKLEAHDDRANQLEQQLITKFQTQEQQLAEKFVGQDGRVAALEAQLVEKFATQERQITEKFAEQDATLRQLRLLLERLAAAQA